METFLPANLSAYTVILNQTQQKQTTILQHKISTKPKASYDLWPGKGMGLFL